MADKNKADAILDALQLLMNEQDIYNHYVASTRAKSSLNMVYINEDW